VEFLLGPDKAISRMANGHKLNLRNIPNNCPMNSAVVQNPMVLFLVDKTLTPPRAGLGIAAGNALSSCF